jgi:hypothetical protein
MPEKPKIPIEEPRRFFSKVYADDENADSFVAIIYMDAETIEKMKLMQSILSRTQLTITDILELTETNYSAEYLITTEELFDTGFLEHIDEGLYEVPNALKTPDEVDEGNLLVRYAKTDFDRMTVNLNGYVSFMGYLDHSPVQVVTQAWLISDWEAAMAAPKEEENVIKG